MSLRRIKHMFLRLSPEEKVIGIGGILVIIGSFMPWFYEGNIVSPDQSTIYNGFGGDLGIIGFIIFILVLLAMLNLIGEHLHIKLPQFGYSKEQVLFFLMGQSAFLVLLSIATYTKISLGYHTAELRFGIYFVLVGSFLGAFAAFAQIQKLKKKDVEKFFGHEEDSHVETKSVASDMPLEEEPEQEDEQQLFEEPEPVADAEPVESEPEEEEKITEDEVEDEVEEIIREKVAEDEEEEGSQGKYFSREAGINGEADAEIDDFEEKPDVVTQSAATDVSTEDGDEEPEKPEDEDDKKSPGISMNFYEDQ